MKTFNKSYLLAFELPDVYAHWVSNNTVISPAESMHIEPSVGGIYRLNMPGGMSMIGEFSEVQPEQRLVYSWQWQGSEETTQIEVVFEEQAEQTAVHLTHSGFTSEDSYNNHASGWDNYIEGFTQHLLDYTEG